MPITIIMSKEQVEMAIPILHREIGYTEHDEELADLVEVLEQATEAPP